MGALHAGHLALMARARQENDLAVASIFVNPLQFNDPADLARYPRTPTADQALLQAAGVDALLMPTAQDVYPEGEPLPFFDLAPLDGLLEGAHRPGHFQGVAQVVARLLAFTLPTRLYMGLKDYQQCRVVARMLTQLHGQLPGPPPELVLCPTLRDPDGLAMSSRNVLLTATERELAPAIHQTLLEVQRLAGNMPPAALGNWAAQQLGQVPGFAVDYVELCNAQTLQPATHWNAAAPNVVLAAVRVGKVRLIDNLVLPC